MSEAKPEAPMTIQRRANYRIRVPQGTQLVVRVWKFGRQDSLLKTPMSANLLADRAKDVSEKGMGILLRPATSQTADLDAVERVRVQLDFGELTATLVGRLKIHDPAKATTVRPEAVGVLFVFDLNSTRDRKNLAALTRILAQLRREEARDRQQEVA